MKILFVSAAEKEFVAAIEFYEMEMPGLGQAFIQEIEKSLHRITQFPKSYTALSKNTRRCLVSRFPYGIIFEYQESENLILIFAIANLHRKPDYWKNRLI
jgi:plasmid stabilization system protein ParE